MANSGIPPHDLQTPDYFLKTKEKDNSITTSDTENQKPRQQTLTTASGNRSNYSSLRYWDGPVLKRWGSDLDIILRNGDRKYACCVDKIFVESWFFKLPVETRNRVYTYYFFPEGTDWAPCPYFSPRLGGSWKMPIPALLRTCRDIRKEAIGIYYSEFRIAAPSPAALIVWFKTLDPAARAALSSVSLQYDWSDKKRQEDHQQIRKYWRQFKINGVEISKDIIKLV